MESRDHAGRAEVGQPPVAGPPGYRVGMYSYELHEGEDDVFSDLLLAHDELFEADEFFEMVQRIRRRVQDDFTHDTLLEAIGEGLEAEYGFSPIDDDELVASIHVSRVGGERHRPGRTFSPEPEWGDDDDGDDDDDDDDEEDEPEADVEAEADLDALPDYVTIRADLRPDEGARPHCGPRSHSQGRPARPASS